MSFRFLLFLLIPILSFGQSQEKVFSYLDVFDLEYVSDPQISPQGDWIVYRRMGFDIMEDKAVGNLWMVKPDGSQHQKITSREVNESSPVWSPKGDRLAFISATEEGSEIYMYWTGSGKLAKISQLPFSPSSLTWSPQGDQLAFSMHVDKPAPVAAKIPKKPKGAKWAAAPRITDRLYHERDGRGYIDPGFNHIFLIPADGGAVRQLTSGDYHHSGPLSWSLDGQKIYFSGNRNQDWEYDFRNSEVYSVAVNSGSITQLTDKPGPDNNPVVSPNGKYIAYVGYEDKVQAYQVTRLYLMDTDGKNQREIAMELDRDVNNIVWDAKSRGLYFAYDDKGNSKIGYVSLNGKFSKLADNMGGTTLGRPYASGSFSVSTKGDIAYTQSTPYYPSELAVVDARSRQTKKITDLNKALFSYRTLGKVEEVWYTSSVDQRELQGWIVYPPNYEEGKKYPFLVENHGGPILNYGDRFSAEVQLYAAAGYVVFY
ncbi:MAG: DPP IV N-terminal domain-containing protein, partial [Arenibacter sp.]|nr:DPP IV N-terminal domain-containing protein [Arenibacter sp.]